VPIGELAIEVATDYAGRNAGPDQEVWTSDLMQIKSKKFLSCG
jgi:hypothetical protein